VVRNINSIMMFVCIYQQLLKGLSDENDAYSRPRNRLPKSGYYRDVRPVIQRKVAKGAPHPAMKDRKGRGTVRLVICCATVTRFSARTSLIK
jgi:hypothetical protein